MAEVAIKYKDSVIAEMNESGVKTLNTSGCYCEGDVIVDYKPNSKTYEVTLSKASGWVLLTTLDSDVLEHINDATFSANLQIVNGVDTVEKYAITLISAGNSPIGYNGAYPIYGIGTQQSSATALLYAYNYYPANNADTGIGLGGIGAFRVANGKYYVRHYDAYIHSGTYRLVLAW